MKQIISCLTIALMLFACSKTQLVDPLDQEITPENSLRAKKGGGGKRAEVTTNEARFILPFGATSGGIVTLKNVSEMGVCFSTSPNPTIDDETVTSSYSTFSSILSGLVGGTTYYARAYANKSKKGTITTTYGNQVSFTTPLPVYGTVTDIDGNTYTTVEIGSQVWTMENLKTTKYRDATLIPNVTDDASWGILNSGAYCYYGNNVNNVATYGMLYNWYAVDDAHNIAPKGWHVATTAEWKTLVDYVGGRALYDAGGKLKEEGFAHWNPPSVNGNEGNNSSGFTALGGGERTIYSSSAPFTNMKRRGNWWTGTGSEGDYADFVYLQSSTAAIMGSVGAATGFDNFDKKCGYSVRLVKD